MMFSVPEPQWFSPDQLDDLQRYLEDIDQRTQVRAVQWAEDVRMSPDWKTPDGYRLTHLAFKQIGTMTAAGLCSLVADVGGFRLKEREVAISPHVAATVFNHCVNLRFDAADGLGSYLMSCDEGERTIDAIVSQGYKHLGNSQFLQMACEAMEARYDKYVFAGAYAVGRWLSFAFCRDRTLFGLRQGNEAAYAGWHFSNSEAGEASVSLAPAIVVDSNMRHGIAWGKPKRLPHSGTKFYRRLAMLVSGGRTTDTEKLVAGYIAACQTPYRVAVRDVKLRRKRVEREVQRLVAAGVPAGVASDVVVQALARNPKGAVVADLFRVMLQLATEQHPRIKHPLEKQAYRLIEGKHGKEGSNEGRHRDDTDEEGQDNGVG
jgi:hypothetical protein